MIGMALALEPQVVVMDEPTTALDVVMQRQILAQLVELRERLDFSVLFITHDLSLLVEFSDRIAIMYGGRIVEEAPSLRDLPRPAAPLQPGAARLLPGAARTAARADRYSRLAAGPARHADRLHVPSALPARLRPLREAVPVLGNPTARTDPTRRRLLAACHRRHRGLTWTPP